MANIFDDLENQDGLVVDEKELLRRRLEAQQNPFLASEQASSSMPASPLQERFDAGVVERMKIPTLKGQDVSIDEQTGLITSIPSLWEAMNETVYSNVNVVSWHGFIMNFAAAKNRHTRNFIYSVSLSLSQCNAQFEAHAKSTAGQIFIS